MHVAVQKHPIEICSLQQDAFSHAVCTIATIYITQNVQPMGQAKQVTIASNWLDSARELAGSHFNALAKLHRYLDSILDPGDSAAGLRQQLADASDLALFSAPETAMDSSPRPGIFLLPTVSFVTSQSLCCHVRACDW